jgi:hypothetical protein
MYTISSLAGHAVMSRSEGIGLRRVPASGVTVHGPGERDTAFWRVSPPPTPSHNVAAWSEF